MDWFLYGNGLCHESVKQLLNISDDLFSHKKYSLLGQYLFFMLLFFG